MFRRILAGAFLLLALMAPAAATVNSSANKTIVAGNGSQTVFAFSFIGVAAQYISVIYTDASGNQTTLSQGSGTTQYQISLNAPVQGAIWGLGGTVTYNPSGTPIAAGTTLTIVRTLPLTQAITLQNQSSVQTLGKGSEQAVDTAVMQDQQTAEQIGRALQMNIANTAPPNPLPPAAQVAGLGLCFDSTGNNVIGCLNVPSGVISSAMVPVVGAATIGVAQNLLGVPQSVKTFGAQGNSNGTHGNGADDTAAVSAAMDASSDVYFPCGVYRITTTITKTSTTNHYYLHGDGPCSQIYLDNSVTQPLFQFTPASICSACVRIEYLNFIPPTTLGNSTATVSLTNETLSEYNHNSILGYQVGIAYISGAFAPHVEGNFSISLATGFIFVGGIDATLNGARIWRNIVLASGLVSSTAALTLNCGTGSNNISLIGNDLEGNYGNILLSNGCTSVDILDNYIDATVAGDAFNFSGTGNSGVVVRGNWLGAQPSQNLVANVSKLVFGTNTVYNHSNNWASTAQAVQIEHTNVIAGTGSIGALQSMPAPSACGASPVINGNRWHGLVEVGGGTVTSCTVTFDVPFDANPACAASAVGPGITIANFSSLVSTGFTLVLSTSASGLFSYLCDQHD